MIGMCAAVALASGQIYEYVSLQWWSSPSHPVPRVSNISESLVLLWGLDHFGAALIGDILNIGTGIRFCFYHVIAILVSCKHSSAFGKKPLELFGNREANIICTSSSCRGRKGEPLGEMDRMYSGQILLAWPNRQNFLCCLNTWKSTNIDLKGTVCKIGCCMERSAPHHITQRSGTCHLCTYYICTPSSIPHSVEGNACM